MRCLMQVDDVLAFCFNVFFKIGFTFLVPAHPGGPGKRAVKGVCVCVCVCFNAFSLFPYVRLVVRVCVVFLLVDCGMGVLGRLCPRPVDKRTVSPMACDIHLQGRCMAKICRTCYYVLTIGTACRPINFSSLK